MNKKGQSILEYVIILTAVIAAIVVGALAISNTGSSTGLTKVFSQSQTKIENASTGLLNELNKNQTQ